MGKKRKKQKTDLLDKKLALCDEYCMMEHLVDLGFDRVDQILDLRVYDLLNLNRISRNRAEEIVFVLYRFLNENQVTDQAIREHTMEQNFNFGDWHLRNGRYARVTVRDLVLDEDMNYAALKHLFHLIARAFFNSDEYATREYRYYDRDEYEEEMAAIHSGRNRKTAGGSR